jgi:anti-sigma factor RsiW
MDCIGTQNFLHLYLDRELGAPETAAYENHLRECPECRAQFAEARGLGDALKSIMPRHVAPAGLRDSIRAKISLPKRRRAIEDLPFLLVGRNPAALAASVMLAVVASSAVTASYLRPSAEDRILQDVVTGHIRSLLEDGRAGVAATDRNAVEHSFAGKLDVSPPAVDLAASGYPLAGTRIDYIGGRPAAALVYSHGSHVIDVFVCPRRANDGDGPESFATRGYNIAYFVVNRMDYWLVSDLDRRELEGFAKTLDAATRRAP